MNRRQQIGAGIIVAALVVALTGCEGEEPAGPEDVAMSFHQELRSGNMEAAMNRLWPESRTEVEKVYEDVDDLLGADSPLRKDRVLVLTSLESSRLMDGVEVKEEIPVEPGDGERATVIISTRDEREVTMALRWKESDRQWLVELPLEDKVSVHERIVGINEEESQKGESQ